MSLQNFTGLDFDQIKTTLKDYLKNNSNFTDYDFEGSNLSTILDVLAYNTYINSYNANMISNEVFIDSATLRENVVALARNIGYLPRSKKASRNKVTFFVDMTSVSPTPSSLTLKKGPVASTSSSFGGQSFVFNIPDDETVSVIESTTSGSVDSLQIINAGDNYQIGDNVKFDNTDTNGGGLSVAVTGIEGEKITSIETTVNNYEDAVFIWKDSNTVSAYIATAPSLNTEDNVVVSGLSTTSIKGLTGNHILGIGTARTFVYKEIPAATGVAVTDIYVTTMPDQISAGSSISIGTEKLSVLNTFDVHKFKKGNALKLLGINLPFNKSFWLLTSI